MERESKVEGKPSSGGCTGCEVVTLVVAVDADRAVSHYGGE